MVHPLNKQVSTIKTSEIYDEALSAVKMFIGKNDGSRTLPHFGTHISLEDLAMDAVEKVVRANPMYITKTYVRIAARCVCIDRLKSKKLSHITINPYEDEEFTAIEETMEGDIHDEMGELEELLLESLTDMQKVIYKKLMENKMYVEIAEDLGISLRTLERQVQELKWLCEYQLIGFDPDTNKHSLLF